MVATVGYKVSQNVVSNKKKDNVAFGASQVNIMAVSDVHGRMKDIEGLCDNFQSNLATIFPDKDMKSTLNVFAIAGDWFMNPGQKGFASDRTKTAAYYQTLFLDKFIETVKNKVPGLKTVFTPGNHCLEGGDRLLLNNIKDSDLTTIISNANLENSSAVKELSALEREKVKQYQILEVPDDKNPNVKNKVLVMGVVVPGIDYYNPKMVEGIDIIDRKSKTEISIEEHELKQTYDVFNKLIKEFKTENPKGAVVMMSHTGNRISEMFANRVDDIDIILNAHDHENKEIIYKHMNGKETKVISLWQNCKKLEAVKLHFDDNGNLDNLKGHYATTLYTHDAPKTENNPFGKLYKDCFDADNKPFVSIHDPNGADSLEIENIRYDNNALANLMTDGILKVIKKTYPETVAFSITSSAFRQELPTAKNRAATNMEVMNLLSGSIESLSQICVGKMTGKELSAVILENLQDNLKDKHRNTIMQWSGVIIDKAGIDSAISTGKAVRKTDTQSIYKYIQIKNENGEYEQIQPNKDYQIAFPNKFFIRSKDPAMKAKESEFIHTNRNMTELFDEYIDDNNGKLKVPTEVRILS